MLSFRNSIILPVCHLHGCSFFLCVRAHDIQAYLGLMHDLCAHSCLFQSSFRWICAWSLASNPQQSLRISYIITSTMDIMCFVRINRMFFLCSTFGPSELVNIWFTWMDVLMYMKVLLASNLSKLKWHVCIIFRCLMREGSKVCLLSSTSSPISYTLYSSHLSYFARLVS